MWLATLNADQIDTLRQYNPTAMHPSTLYKRCREQFTEWLTPTRAGVASGDTEDQQSDLSKKPANPLSEPGKTADEPVAETASHNTSKPICIDTRSPLVRLLGHDIAKILLTHYTHVVTRQGLNKLVQTRGGKKVVKRLAEMVEESQYPSNDLHIKRPSHLLLVQDLPHDKPPYSWVLDHGSDWDNPRAINAILDEIDDAKRMLEELGVGRPMSDYKSWWDKRNSKPALEPAGPDLSAFSTPVEFKPRIRPAHDGEIRVYGQTIWPCEGATYSHDEAWAAFKFWEEEDRIVATAHGMSKPSSRGRHFMSMSEYINRISRGFYRAFHKIGCAQHQIPEQGADTFAPHQHLNEA